MIYVIGIDRKVIFCTSVALLLAFNIVSLDTLYATTASQVPHQVFAQDSAGEEHELKLRATEEDGRIETVPGFTLPSERVPQVNEGTNLVVTVKINDPATGQAAPDTRVVDVIKVTDPNSGQVIKEITPSASNIFSLLGLQPGIYQVDAIVQLTEDTKGAYESILTVSAPGQNAPPAEQIRNVQKTVITRTPEPVFIPVPVGVPVPAPTSQVPTPAPAAPPQPLTGQQQAAPPQPLTGQQQLPPIDPCIADPTLPECQVPPPVDPCIADPTLPECQLPPPVDPCIADPTLPECQPTQALTPLGGPEPVDGQLPDTEDGTFGEGEDTGEPEAGPESEDEGDGDGSGESDGSGDGDGSEDGEG